MRFKSWYLLREMAQVRKISPEQAREMKLFGPVYHGTTADSRDIIAQQGFKIFANLPRQGNVTNGYLFQSYSSSHNEPPPIHHLGFGIYFTTSKTRGKMYNSGTATGLKPYYIYAPRMETINFGSPNTMMKWWRANGYDMTSLGVKPGQEKENEWLRATQNLTNTLKSKYDAVWFKGKGIKRLLDGDQIVVFNPDNIFEINNSLSSGYDNGQGVTIKQGDRFKIKNVMASAVIKGMRVIEGNDIIEQIKSRVFGSSNYDLSVDIKKDAIQQVHDYYHEALYNAFLKAQDDPFFQRHQEHYGGPEGAATHLTNYVLDKWNFQLRFPSSLVEKVLKPRERLS